MPGNMPFRAPELGPRKIHFDIAFNESADRFTDRITNVAALTIAPSDYLGMTLPDLPRMGLCHGPLRMGSVQSAAACGGSRYRKRELTYE